MLYLTSYGSPPRTPLQVPHFSLMTAVGSDASSNPRIQKPMAGFAQYSKVKGDAEVAVADLNFPSTHIDRPAGIVGNPNSGVVGNAVMRLFSPILCGSYTNLSVTELAQGMIRAIQRAVSGAPAPSSEGAVVKRADGSVIPQRDSLRVYHSMDLRVLCGEFNAVRAESEGEAAAAAAPAAAAPAAAPAAAAAAPANN